MYPYDVERAFNVRFGRNRNLNVFCPWHEDPESSTSQSCSVCVDGVFNCQVCGAKGTAPEFYAKVHDRQLEWAQQELLQPNKPLEPVANRQPQGYYSSASVTFEKYGPNIIKQCAAALWEPYNKHFVHYLYSRGFTEDTLRGFCIGADEYRITIPVMVRDKWVNIRRYLPKEFNKTGGPKMVSHRLGNSAPTLFPQQGWHNNSEDYTILCEGEWDALLLRQEGFASVTNTGNCKCWCAAWTRALAAGAHKRVAVIYDVNDKNDFCPHLNDLGQREAAMRVAELRLAGLDAWRVPLPLDTRGGDITDYFQAGHDYNDLKGLIKHYDELRCDA